MLQRLQIRQALSSPKPNPTSRKEGYMQLGDCCENAITKPVRLSVQAIRGYAFSMCLLPQEA